MRANPAPASQFQWQRERAARLNRICSSIEGRIERGQTLRRSIQWFAWYYSDHHYRCESHRRFRLGRGTLLRLYYVWKKNGKTPSVFTLRYRSGWEKLNRKLLVRFLNICLGLQVSSYRAAHKRFGVAVTESALLHAMPRPIRTELVALFAHRRNAGRAAERVRLAMTKEGCL